MRGRRRECAVFDGLLEGVRAGRSGALVVRGEAGVGKTALLEYAIESAPDLHIDGIGLLVLQGLLAGCCRDMARKNWLSSNSFWTRGEPLAPPAPGDRHGASGERPARLGPARRPGSSAAKPLRRVRPPVKKAVSTVTDDVASAPDSCSVQARRPIESIVPLGDARRA